MQSTNKKNIIIFGAGYVGMSLSILLSQTHDVVLIDIDETKVNQIKQKISPIKDELIEKYLAKKKLSLVATSKFNIDINSTDTAILALPTNFNSELNSFDTSIISGVIAELQKKNFSGNIVIKSTVPIGFTDSMNKQFPDLNILFSPEFLREGSALEVNLYPSRIIVGNIDAFGKEIGELFKSFSLNDPKVYTMPSSEAEAVKLFANSYLANRVSFFNELDSFCLDRDLDSKSVITGISSDPRIGFYYNNPSFGYGGYCLPKDSKQLLVNFKRTPAHLLNSVIESNESRKLFIANKIVDMNPSVVGVYRLVMKSGSDNFRESAIFDVIRILKQRGISIIVYEPFIKEEDSEFIINNDLISFKKKSNLIITNRYDNYLDDVFNKVFTRDIFGNN